MAGKRLGYKRVSDVDQNPARQLDGIEVDKVFEDHASGKNPHRPQLEALLSYARDGDTIICHSIDRMARSLPDLRAIVDGCVARSVTLRFEKENLTFDGTNNSRDTLLLNILAAFAEFERSLLLERQREGIAVARARNRYLGSKPKLSAEQADELRRLAAEGVPKSVLGRKFKLSRQSVYEYINQTHQGAA